MSGILRLSGSAEVLLGHESAGRETAVRLASSPFAAMDPQITPPQSFLPLQAGKNTILNHVTVRRGINEGYVGKMNPAFSEKWKELYPDRPKQGISLRFDHVHPYVRAWLIIYTRWLRETYRFPVHVNVNCVYGRKIRCDDHSLAFARIIEPVNRGRKPVIILACGAFPEDREIDEYMRDETELILYSFSHEIIHYFQYINGFDMTGRGVEWQASYYGKRLLRTFDALYDDEQP